MNNNIISSCPDKVIEMARATDSSGKETYTKSQMPSQKQASSKHDFSDCREMMQSAKNMSGGSSNITKELDRLEGTNTLNPINSVPSPPSNILFLMPPMLNYQNYNNNIPSIERKPRLIDLEIPNFSSAEEFKKWLSFLNIIFFYKKNYISFLKELFQGGEFDQNNSLFKYKDYLVILESQQFVRELQLELPFGGWYNKNNLEYGLDLISLCICHLKIGFGKLVTMYSKIAENLYNLKRIRNKDEQPWIIQVKLPITPYDFRKIKISGAQKVHESRYYTAYHVLQKIVEYWELSNGEIVSVYYTLWRHWNSKIYHSQMLNPQPPYYLYNLHLIHDNPEAEIIFVKDEKIADFIQKLNKPKENIITTCYGGHKNLLEAELGDLKNRGVIIVVYPDTPEIQLIPKIIDRLSSAELKQLYFTFDEEKNRVSVQEFMTDPVKWGCNASLNEAESVKSNIFLDNEKWKNYIKNSPQRSKLLSNIILGGQLIWIYAPPKIGKTWFGLNIAYTVGKGGCKIGPWETFSPVKVIYIDGEMHHDDLDINIIMVMAGQGDTSGIPPFNIASASLRKNGRINLLDTDDQKEIEDWLLKNRTQLVIFDNFYSLTDNPQQSFHLIVDWLCKLRSLGITVIVLDHTNEEDKVQGEKKKLWRADLAISIQKDPEDMTDKIILLNFIGRRLTENDKRTVRLRKVFTDDSFRFELVEGHNVTESLIPEKIKTFAKAMFLKTSKKMTYEKIAKETEFSKSAISKYINDTIPALTGKNKKMYEEELSRLIAEDEMTALT